MTDPAQAARARKFAVLKHAGQLYSGAPYEEHLDEVVRLVAPFGSEARTVAYLHDVLEDTDATPGELVREFGQRVADCVALLTDEPGSRRERKAKSHARLAGAASGLETALVVKVADRLANLRGCVRSDNGKLLRMYCGEHAEFRAAVYRPGLCEHLWEEMEEIIASSESG